jgi:multiple sugar transport system ATP-binding protein
VYPDGTRALSDFNLHIADGEFMVFVGPSGCGKTTALRMVAGLEEITEGEIRIGDELINTVEPRQRDVAMVFQNYALYPHMSVFENIAFPLRARRLSRSEIERRVVHTASLLGLEDLLKRRPRALSGGQRQRVAMGRAIVREPQVFLMDEPLSNLDAKLRVQMRAEITRLQRRLGVTTIYVTHDQVEALTMGDRIVVMRKGVLQQVGPPQELFDRPANLFVASFIGSPVMNMLRATIRSVANGRSFVCCIGDQELALPESFADERPEIRSWIDRDLVVGIRPEHMVDAALDADRHPRLRARAVLVQALGSERLVHFEMPGHPVLTDEVLEVARDADASIAETLEREAKGGTTVSLIARYDTRSSIAVDENAEIAVPAQHLHFFDLGTGAVTAAPESNGRVVVQEAAAASSR